MATTITSVYTRTSTEDEFPKLSDQSSDFDVWRRQYFTDNGVDIAFSLSSDQLTLTVTIEHDSDATYETYKTARDANADYIGKDGLVAWLNTATSDPDIGLTVTLVNDAGNSSQLWPE
tara:strand:+ start:93 stop:446 length:354 start_codon:yes stop_codon:yes gene_type:complete